MTAPRVRQDLKEQYFTNDIVPHKTVQQNSTVDKNTQIPWKARSQNKLLQTYYNLIDHQCVGVHSLRSSYDPSILSFGGRSSIHSSSE